MENNSTLQQLTKQIANANENTWLRIGILSELLNEPEKASMSYENVLRHNPYNLQALLNLSSLYKNKEQFPKAIEYYLRLLNVEASNGEIWGDLGYCYIMTDEVHKAHSSFEKAINLAPKSVKVWFGLGLLYDKVGSLENATEAFLNVINLQPNFDRIVDVYFRLGVLMKQQQKYEQSLIYFNKVINNPKVQNLDDVWYQIGNTYELQKEFDAAKDSYEHVLTLNQNHLKSLQQLGWLYHTKWENNERAINYLLHAVGLNDQSDGQSWYILGRCYMAQKQFTKAYDAYQQAVYRDTKNPIFWCSIGVLYHQLNQHRDALSAYSTALNLNPYLGEVWVNLGTLYESCKQYSDSIDAFQRAYELEPSETIKERLSVVKSYLTTPPSSKEQTDQPTPSSERRNESPPKNNNSNPSNTPNYNGIATLAKISCELESDF